MKSQIQSLEVSYMVHATEDQDKIGRAVSDLIGPIFAVETEQLQGHHGNEILRARIHLTGEEAARAFDAMVSKISPGARAEIRAQILTLVDEHSALFLRFDKQELVSGNVMLGAGDSVRVKVKPRAFLIKGGAAEFYSELLG